jgi:hypothetical protein
MTKTNKDLDNFVAILSSILGTKQKECKEAIKENPQSDYLKGCLDTTLTLTEDIEWELIKWTKKNDPYQNPEMFLDPSEV